MGWAGSYNSYFMGFCEIVIKMYDPSARTQTALFGNLWRSLECIWGITGKLWGELWEARATTGGPGEVPGRLWRGRAGSREPRGLWEKKCVKTIVFYSKLGRDPLFRLDETRATLTVYRACAQK